MSSTNVSNFAAELKVPAEVLLEQLRASDAEVPRRLDAAAAAKAEIERVRFDEMQFRFELNEDAMASDKLAEGIRAFVADARKLDGLIAAAGAA